MPSFFLKASCHSMTFLKILLKFGFFWKEYWLLPICKHGFRGVWLSGAPNYISQLDRLAWFSAATALIGSLERSPCWFQYRYNVMELCHAILHGGGGCQHPYLQMCSSALYLKYKQKRLKCSHIYFRFLFNNIYCWKCERRKITKTTNRNWLPPECNQGQVSNDVRIFCFVDSK